jgi:hypothetical protein
MFALVDRIFASHEDSDICPAKARRTPSSDKYYFFFFAAPSTLLRTCSGHALRPFGCAQDMLCGRYFDSFGCGSVALNISL